MQLSSFFIPLLKMSTGGVPIFNSQSNTYLTLDQNFVEDYYSNALVAIPPSHAINLGPVLLSFDLDMNTGTILFTFSEPVLDSFSCVGFTMQATSSSSLSQYSLTTDVLVIPFKSSVSSAPTTFSSSFFSALNAVDVNNLKLLGIGKNASTTFLSVVFNQTVATSPYNLIPSLSLLSILSASPLQVSHLTQDTTPPLCIGFGLDLNAGQLLLFFTEPVDAASFLPTGHFFASPYTSSFRLNVLNVYYYRCYNLQLYGRADSCVGGFHDRIECEYGFLNAHPDTR